MPRRCEWAEGDDPLLVSYHDEEWGVPSHHDHHLFELLTLEGAQAGLSWVTILHKREGYWSAFQQFDPGRVARFNARTIEGLLRDPAIVRTGSRLNLRLTTRAAYSRCKENSGASRLTYGSSSTVSRSSVAGTGCAICLQRPASRRR